ncbi:hypothetical protein RJT34_31016 [Clitoria ternatea]|uniref:Uncharacterized protein n=1 Tax=Clitoria ternatea TaxID=43366 RepID=A0AAN9I7Z8_CLITE
MDKVMEEFESLIKDAERVQRETLTKILEDSILVEYLQNLGLNGRTNPESFKACIPLVTNKELEPYIYRIVDKDASLILTGKPLTTMPLRRESTSCSCSFPLKATNYHSWSRLMKRSLFSMNMYKFVVGKVKESLSSNAQIALSIVYDNVEELWNDLKERFLK